jgi:hypothetical protein
MSTASLAEDGQFPDILLTFYTLQCVYPYAPQCALPPPPVTDILNNVLCSCVDARGDDDMLSTPGGDFAELSDAIYLFLTET